MSKDVYRSAKTGVAYDEWFQSLSPHGKLLFWIVWNSRDMTACGVVKTTIPTLCFETGLTRDELMTAIKDFCQPFKSETLGEDTPRAYWWPQYNLIWLRNFYKLQRSNTNPGNFDKSAQVSLATMPDVVKATVLGVYAMLGNPIDNHSDGIGMGYQWDGDGIPFPSDRDIDPFHQQKPVNSNKKPVNSNQTSSKQEIEAKEEETTWVVKGVYAPQASPPTEKPKTKATSYPATFAITDAMRDWAAKTVPQLDIGLATEQWADSMRANTTKYKYTDWVSAWRTAMRNADKWAKERGTRNGKPTTTAVRGQQQPDTTDKWSRASHQQVQYAKGILVAENNR